ncbi:MAG: heme exporter protein CcmB [Bacteroidetes bacterium]|nr:heme exporter protein CcmB [Bacteroidota bacterium]
MLLELIRKEFKLELRRKSVVAGLGLYLFSMVFISYLAFALKQNLITPLVWSALFWISILFTAINSVAKSFIGEKRGMDIYYYTIASPVDFLLSKILYNFFLCLIMALTGYFLFTLFLNDPIENKLIFIATLALASGGFAASLTLLSGIASKANNSNILMAVLSFPVVISILLMAIKLTKNCIDGLDNDANYEPLLTLFAINCLVTAVSYLLFPFIWKS